MAFAVIGITGKRGSGKDTAANHLKKHGFRVLTFTNDVLAPLLKVQGKEISRDNLIELGVDLREKFGPAAMAKLITERIHLEGKYVISGIRTKPEVEYFRNKYGDDFRLISIETKDRKRYDRSKKRGIKGEAKLTFRQFMEIEKKPTEKPIPQAMKIADFSLKNDGTEKSLFKAIEDILKSTGRK